MIASIKKLLEGRCSGCSMLEGSMGQSSPCRHCDRGDLNSSRFDSDEAFWDALDAKTHGRALSLGKAEASSFAAVFDGRSETIQGVEFKNGSRYEVARIGKDGKGLEWFAFRPEGRSVGWVKIAYSSIDSFRKNWTV